MIIYIDMDQVITEWWRQVGRFALDNWDIDCSEVTREDLTWGPEWLPEPRRRSHGLTKHEVRKRIVETKGFWETMPPIEGAQETLAWLELSEGDVEAYIVTSLWHGNPNCYREKRDWLRNFLPWWSPFKLITMNHKHLLAGDLMIDDKPENLKRFNGETICYDYPYNRDVEATHRVTNWAELRRLLEVKLNALSDS